MGYAESDVDRKIRKWFESDQTCSTLHKISLKGSIRGIKNVSVDFTYPITAIAGRNGCGKTTVLALAACAYHNNADGYKNRDGRNTYYTFSDFFIQTAEENKLDGVEISYRFLYNNWRGRQPGLGRQKMWKRMGGKWSKYEKRMKKNVIFLGIDRMVPQSERKIFKNKMKFFTDDAVKDWHDDVKKHVGKILNKNYSQFKLKTANAYSLQVVKERNVTYSGFNMGAGEKALFELFSLIYKCSSSGLPALIIIDEIELGLHEYAQQKLIEVLKDIVKSRRLQILFTTHSPVILNSLPPDARIFIENVGGELVINKGISGEFAAGRMAEKNSNELEIYVEDDIAHGLMQVCMNLEQRQRTGIIPIGSGSAVCRQLAAAYRHPVLKKKSIAILDGDQRKKKSDLINNMMKDLELSTPVEKAKFNEWVADRISFLPGDENPEKWILRKAYEFCDATLATRLKVKLGLLKEEIELAIEQPVHEEFFYLSKQLSIDVESLIIELTMVIAVNNEEGMKKVVNYIDEHLD